MPQWGADEGDGGNCWMLTYTDARETVSRSFWNTVFLLCIPELSKHTLTILPETAYGWTLLRVLPSARLLQQQLTEFGGVKGVAWLGIHYSQRCFDVKPLEGAGNAWKRRWGGDGGGGGRLQRHVQAGEQILSGAALSLRGWAWITESRSRFSDLLGAHVLTQTTPRLLQSHT